MFRILIAAIVAALPLSAGQAAIQGLSCSLLPDRSYARLVAMGARVEPKYDRRFTVSVSDQASVGALYRALDGTTRKLDANPSADSYELVLQRSANRPTHLLLISRASLAVTLKIAPDSRGPASVTDYKTAAAGNCRVSPA